jgi:hypothetical protein
MKLGLNLLYHSAECHYASLRSKTSTMTCMFIFAQKVMPTLFYNVIQKLVKMRKSKVRFVKEIAGNFETFQI